MQSLIKPKISQSLILIHVTTVHGKLLNIVRYHEAC